MASRVIAFQDYLTSDGESFLSIAYRMYGVEQKATDIIRYNRKYCKYVRLPAGLVIRIPIFEKDEAPRTKAPWARGSS